MRASKDAVVPTIAIGLAAVCLWVVPTFGSNEPGWDPALLGLAITAAVPIILGGWGIQQAVSARRQAASAEQQEGRLREQNDLIREQLAQAADDARHQGRAANETLRIATEQRLDAQMPSVSIRLKTFHLQPPPLFTTDEEGNTRYTRPDGDVPLVDGVEIWAQGRVEVRNHGAAPVMLNLLEPSFGVFDSQPIGPLGPAGSAGLFRSPDTTRGDVADYGWEENIKADVLRERLERGGWDGHSWDLLWSVEVTNLQSTVRDTIRIRATYKPFRRTEGEDGIEQWVWTYVPPEFYGAYGTEHHREYLSLEPREPDRAGDTGDS